MVGEKGVDLSSSLIVEKGQGEALYHLLKHKKWLDSKRQPKEIENVLLQIVKSLNKSKYCEIKVFKCVFDIQNVIL